MMRYVSTRGEAPSLDFEQVVLTGLAPDGGLYLPSEIPVFSQRELAKLATLEYPELACAIIHPFTGDAIAREALLAMLKEAYGAFTHTAVAPLTQLAHRQFLLELFHGPTLAFKDFALQFLGRLLDHFLTRRGEHAIVLGATSGDTGSAAIAGCRGRAGMDIVILHPRGRTSEVQRRQMTTILDANVHNIALEGTFDDCQDAVKALFTDENFRARHRLVAVNSINWARILAQTVYYFYAAFSLGAPARQVDFSVPTGNFGDIYAGYLAKRMGLPAGRLIIATNRNDILARCVATGTYAMEGVAPTLSPSMDIQISSNFERLLFDLNGRDAAAVCNMMQELRQGGSMTLTPQAHAALRKDFAAMRIDDDATLATIARTYRETGTLLDPHSAVGVAAGAACHEGDNPLVVLATAHPAKFPDAVAQACGIHPPLPAAMADLYQREERCTTLANIPDAVKAYIERFRTGPS